MTSEEIEIRKENAFREEITVPDIIGAMCNSLIDFTMLQRVKNADFVQEAIAFALYSVVARCATFSALRHVAPLCSLFVYYNERQLKSRHVAERDSTEKTIVSNWRESKESVNDAALLAIFKSLFAESNSVGNGLYAMFSACAQRLESLPSAFSSSLSSTSTFSSSSSSAFPSSETTLFSRMVEYVANADSVSGRLHLKQYLERSDFAVAQLQNGVTSAQFVAELLFLFDMIVEFRRRVVAEQTMLKTAKKDKLDSNKTPKEDLAYDFCDIATLFLVLWHARSTHILVQSSLWQVLKCAAMHNDFLLTRESTLPRHHRWLRVVETMEDACGCANFGCDVFPGCATYGCDLFGVAALCLVALGDDASTCLAFDQPNAATATTTTATATATMTTTATATATTTVATASSITTGVNTNTSSSAATNAAKTTATTTASQATNSTSFAALFDANTVQENANDNENGSSKSVCIIDPHLFAPILERTVERAPLSSIDADSAICERLMQNVMRFIVDNGLVQKPKRSSADKKRSFRTSADAENAENNANAAEKCAEKEGEEGDEQDDDDDNDEEKTKSRKKSTERLGIADAIRKFPQLPSQTDQQYPFASDVFSRASLLGGASRTVVQTFVATLRVPIKVTNGSTGLLFLLFFVVFFV